MKRTNIDPTALIQVLNGEAPKNTIVGHAKDVHGTFLVAFVDFDKETQTPATSKDGRRYTLNWRKALNRPAAAAE